MFLFNFFLVDSSFTEAERILYRIVEGYSDIDLSENESPVSQTGEGEDADEELGEDDQDAESDVVDKDTRPAKVCCRPIWTKTNMWGSVIFDFEYKRKGNIQKCVPVN